VQTFALSAASLTTGQELVCKRMRRQGAEELRRGGGMSSDNGRRFFPAQKKVLEVAMMIVTKLLCTDPSSALPRPLRSAATRAARRWKGDEAFGGSSDVSERIIT
jgi:hypothetical protein